MLTCERACLRMNETCSFGGMRSWRRETSGQDTQREVLKEVRSGNEGGKKGMGERGLGGLESTELANLSSDPCDGQEEFRQYSSQFSFLTPNL